MRGSIQKRVLSVLGAKAIVLSATLSWAEGAPNHVRDVKIRATDAAGATEIEVVGTTAPVFNVRVESGGKRLLVDIQNSDVVGAKEAITAPVGVVGGVLTQGFKTEAGTMTRLAVNLTKHATYRVRAEGTSLKVALTPAEANGVPTEAPTKAADTSGTSLTDVRFERAKGSCATGCDRVVITTTGVPSYALGTTAGGRARLELKKTQLPKDLSRTLDLAQYRGALKSVSTFYEGDTGSTIVEIDREGSQQGTVSVDGKGIVWSFDVPKGGAQAKGSARKSVTVARERQEDGGPKVETSIRGDENQDMKVEVQGASEAAGFSATLNAQAAGRYNGRRIDLDLKDADIHNILRLLADVGRVNIVTADDVSGNVTIRMRNVPWDQALDVVLQAKGLGMVRSGNLIRVAPLATLQKERELRLAAAKQEYELTPLETRLIPVSYAQAEELQARAKDLLSPRGSIAVDERTNVLIARDIAGNLNNIEELVRSLDTQTPQVLVEARIVEATSRYLRDIGIQWGGDATFSEATGNPTGIAFPSRVGIAGGNYDQNTNSRGLSAFQGNVPQPNFAVNLPAATGTGQGGALGFSLGSIDNNFNIGIRLSAAEASGLLRIVSSPRILTLDNRDARISQGTLIPFSQISAQGVQTTFQEAKLQLLVRPHVTADGSVSMHVKINRDEPDFNQTSARGDPTILKREAETDLLVMDGHTAVIGGIYTRNTGRNLDQVPFFGDIPILGVLFQRRRASDTRNELVIFLTPRIVNRAEALGR
ncbi:Type IV pilus biogenesis protein PilQ [Labilithrix luteola]|uniref:Type IV pilus biogenesis protein PilQ n=1 Tax=Labilithrix luteola TaxID=1391654 RepID=A0A0K1PLY2_9BACT|nr:type IV pilus secretin PilQ [Labilithrix luteola]AKU94532.1 Type IV pilus biogenesis protein PilQ [Labilithrix luteola]